MDGSGVDEDGEGGTEGGVAGGNRSWSFNKAFHPPFITCMCMFLEIFCFPFSVVFYFPSIACCTNC